MSREYPLSETPLQFDTADYRLRNRPPQRVRPANVPSREVLYGQYGRHLRALPRPIHGLSGRWIEVQAGSCGHRLGPAGRPGRSGGLVCRPKDHQLRDWTDRHRRGPDGGRCGPQGVAGTGRLVLPDARDRADLLLHLRPVHAGCFPGGDARCPRGSARVGTAGQESCSRQPPRQSSGQNAAAEKPVPDDAAPKPGPSRRR